MPHHVVSYGPDIPNERAYRLLDNVEGGGCSSSVAAASKASIALAHQGR